MTGDLSGMGQHGGEGEPSVTGGTPRMTVAVVSLGRPGCLRRCLVGVSQLAYPAFEVVVVSDDQGLAAAATAGLGDRVKMVRFDMPNISTARNLAIDHAGGDVVCFIDDDAVPEPTWLLNMAAAFSGPGVAAAVGSVRARNGISFQSFRPFIDGAGSTRDMGETQPDCQAPPGFVPKLVGTNMAIRRAALEEVGGFDERFRFYLEDADIGMRLARAGHRIAFATGAEVHHAFAPSARRDASRMPTSLGDVGRSLSIYVRKHGVDATAEVVAGWARAAERRRLVGLMVRGICEPCDVGRLLASFDAGWAEGAALAPPELRAFSAAPGFQGLGRGPDHAPCHVLVTRPLYRLRAARVARELVAEGKIVTLFCFSPTALFHRVAFHEHGYWVHTGGTFGRSVRTQPVFRPAASGTRAKEEWNRVGRARCPNFDTSESLIRAGRMDKCVD